jgi:hypothetical protein
MENNKIHCVVVCDSRGNTFKDHGIFNKEKYETHYLVYRCAKVPFLTLKTIEFLEKLPKGCIYIVILCAGINGLTYREVHKGGIELIINSQQDLITNILKFKELVRARFPNAIVNLATVSMVDLAAANQTYISRGKLQYLKYTQAEIDSFQVQLSNTVKTVNHRIFVENQHEQYVPGKGLIRPHQIYLHQYVEKVNSKRTAGGRHIVKRRICPESLIDGIHPTTGTVRKWLHGIHMNVMKLCDKLVNPTLL